MAKQESSVGDVHRLVLSNAIMAAVAVLAGSSVEGSVSADVPFRPKVDPGQLSLFEAVVAVQTEVSLSIYARDPLLNEAATGLAGLTEGKDPDAMVQLVDVVDDRVQQVLALLVGRREQILSITDRLASDRTMAIADVRLILGS